MFWMYFCKTKASYLCSCFVLFVCFKRHPHPQQIKYGKHEYLNPKHMWAVIFLMRLSFQQHQVKAQFFSHMTNLVNHCDCGWEEVAIADNTMET